jgi:hypothetical protein
MTRIVPLTIVAGALACFLAAGAAQAAPATAGGILGKLNATADAQTQVEKAGWRKRKWSRRCFRRCMWRTDGRYRFCKHKCRRGGWRHGWRRGW